ncbi:MAG: dockerin type I domain-containing protein [Candidatus Marinimicrobia bacterium]|nr:dockerin type I domain-containing protein [Candidatus Neomarinimicrobiota bacterium]
MNVSWESNLYTPARILSHRSLSIRFQSFRIQTPDFAVTDNQYNIDGQLVSVSGSGNALAAYTDHPSNPAIVLNATGNCFFNAFQAVNFNADNDTDGKADIQELIENQIIYLTEATHIPEWLSTGPPTSGIITPGSSQDVPVNFNATCLSAGEYTGSIDVVSNDPDHELISIPVLCNVVDIMDADITISIADAEGMRGSIVSVPVIADSGFTNVGMLELQVAFDTTVLGYENMYSEHLSASDVNAAGENINIVWVYSSTPMEIPDGDTLIVFRFRVSDLVAGGDHCILGFTEHCNIADPDENNFSLALNPGTFTVIQSYGISGSLIYCDNGTPLIADTLNLCGDVNAIAVTNGDGLFTFSAALGYLELFPLKNDDISGVDGFDLLRLKNSLLEISSLTANEMLAADCDGNGTPDGLDLLRLKNYLLMIPVDPPALTWAFMPEAYVYNPLESEMTGQDFTAFLYGDVNLSWGTSTGTPARSEESAMAHVSFGESLSMNRDFRVFPSIDRP